MMREKTPYPDRPNYWSNNVQRALIQSEAVALIGRDACWLVSFIAAREDILRYRHVPKYWTPQLMDDAGFTNKKKFLQCRKAAIDAGWLIVNGGGKGIEGEYFTAIPNLFSGAKSHQKESIDTESRCEIAPESEPETSVVGSNSHQQKISRCEIAPESEPTNAPHPIPVSPKTKSHTSDADFLNWYNAYPRRVARPKAREAYGKAIQRLTAKYATPDEAAAWLLDVTRKFAASPKGKAGTFTPHPATWLNQERYDDDPAEWYRDSQTDISPINANNGTWQRVQSIVHRVWSPDQRNREQVQRALNNDELYAAVKKLGFSQVADWHPADKTLPTQFMKAWCQHD